MVNSFCTQGLCVYGNVSINYPQIITVIFIQAQKLWLIFAIHCKGFQSSIDSVFLLMEYSQNQDGMCNLNKSLPLGLNSLPTNCFL